MDGGFGLFLLGLFTMQQTTSSSGVEQDFASSDSATSMFFYKDQIYPRDCKEVQDQCSTRNAAGTHLIQPDGYDEPFWVFCSGNWTVFMRRTEGLLDFNRNWVSYRDGFGYLNVDHWLGNERLAQLTNQKTYELRIDFETKSGEKVHLSYDRFRIHDEFSDYRLVSLSKEGGSADSVFEVRSSNRTWRDCYGILKSGETASGDYTIKPSGWTGKAFTVNCNMTIDGGGWTVIQRRIQGSPRLDVNRNWESYKAGFGNTSGEFWIGNEKLFHLTNQREYELRIDMVQYSSHTPYYAKYDFFRINGVTDEYRMIGLGNFTGSAVAVGDALSFHRYMQFSTPDRDNDPYPATNYAHTYGAGWWYYYGYWADLNYNSGSSYFGYWNYPPSGSYYLVYSEMKIRPRGANGTSLIMD